MLQAGGDGEQLLLGQLAHRVHIRHLGLALGDGACLVQHDAGHLAQLLQGLGGLDENAVLSTYAGAHHDGHRGGQSQGTGTGDHQHRHGRGEGLGHSVPADQPHQGGDQGNAHDHGDEDTRYSVGQPGDGGLGGGGLLHQGDHLGQGGVLAHLGGPDGEHASAVETAGHDPVSLAFIYRNGLSGEGGLVHVGHPRHHHPVHREGGAGANEEQIPHLHLLGGDGHLLAVPQHGGGLGAQVHEPGNGLAGLALGAGLQELAQGDEGDNHGRRLKVQVHGVPLHQGGVPVAQPPADGVQSYNAVEHSGGGAHGDEGVHIGGPMPEGAEAVYEVGPVDDQRG